MDRGIESKLELASAPLRSRVGYFRWVICALLFFATTINYIDRQIIGILKPTLSKELGWSEMDYANIVFAFQIAYALGYAGCGRIMDVVGVKTGYALAVTLWSIFAVLHSFMRTVLGFQFVRFGLGLVEGGNFPAAVKSVSEWFPKSERALATGIFNAGSNVGALITPVIVPILVINFGWQTAFFVTGTLGFIWVILWLLVYNEPRRCKLVKPTELAHKYSDSPDPVIKISWFELIKHRQTLAFLIGMFLTSPIWWMYLYWAPDFLNKQYGLDIVKMGLPLVVIYLMTDVGSICGGWLSPRLIKRGWTINKARKFAMLICVICVAPISLASGAKNLWLAVFLIGLAASAHQGWSANLYTIVSDTVPRKAVSSVVGIGGMAGAIGGMFIAKFMGFILQLTGSYKIPFFIPVFSYSIALLLIHLLLPRLETMKLDEDNSADSSNKM